jgi:flagellar biosynthesis protein FlhB
VNDKTEQPTPRRLRKAREEGNSGASAYAAQALAFVVAVALVPTAVAALASWASAALRSVLSRASGSHTETRFDPIELAGVVAALTLPILGAVAFAGAVAQAVQTGGIVSTKKLAPRLDRLNPVAGLQGLFSSTRLFAVGRSLATAAVVGWLAYQALRDRIVDLARVVGRPLWIGAVVSPIAQWLAWRAALVGLAIGALDIAVTRGAWLRKLRMTKEEVRREHREAEGDPQLKAARERAYHELVAQAQIASVRSASVVVVNPTHLACALRYDERQGDSAPVVVAAGEGALAARIVQAARDYGIEVVSDAPLARALVELAPGEAIPEALYEAVAEILREVWQKGS